MKPGIKSSEFYIALALLGFAAWLVHQGKAEAGIAIAGTVSSFYMAGRFGMKVGNGAVKNGGGT